MQAEENRIKCSDAASKAWQDDKYRLIHSEALIQQNRKKPGTEVKYDSILTSLGIDFEPVIIGPYTFDYKIIRPGLKTLLIEVNGNYWHTRPSVIKKDKAKISYISGIPEYELRTIWEHQLADTDRVIYLTKSWMGLLPKPPEISINQVSYKPVEYDKARDFLANYHYLGSMGRSGILIGCYLADQLIGVAILAHPTRRESYTSIGLKKEQMLELTRFALSPHVHNKNLASHFLSRLPKFVPPEVVRLASFSDPSAGHNGTIYKAANWIQDHDTYPSYFYINNQGWKMHKKTLYNQARAMHMTENQYASSFGYEKIHTPPLKKFHLDL